jgi:hypothetical protein
MLRKACAFLELTEAGDRKKALFLLSAVKTFNQVLGHNLADIYNLFDPNCFSPALALARETWFYLTVFFNDFDILESVSTDSLRIREDLTLVLQLINQIAKLLSYRLAYKDEQEQSKEFKNLYVIETCLLILQDSFVGKLAREVCPVLVAETIDNCRTLFQHICGLIGSFDFLLRHITEQILWSSSLNEALLIRCVAFCLNSCYQNEARKKFLGFVRGCFLEVKTKDFKQSSNELLVHYGHDSFSNMLLQLKEKLETNNALEVILHRALSIRDADHRAAVTDFLTSLAQFGDYSLISNVTRFICLKTTKEHQQGRLTRELGNCLKYLGCLTENPYYKSMLLAEDAFRSLNPVFKTLMNAGHKEEDFPILQVYSNLFNAKISINNLVASSGSNLCLDPVSKDYLYEFCKICKDFLNNFCRSVPSGSSSNESNALMSTASTLLATLQSFFDCNYHDSVFHKEFSDDDGSCFSRLLSLLTDQLADLYRDDSRGTCRLVICLLQMAAAVFMPAVLTKDTYRGKRVRHSCQLLANTKDLETCMAHVERLVAATRHVSAELHVTSSVLWKSLALPLQDSSLLENLYKSAKSYEEKDLVKKMNFYDSLYEKTYDIIISPHSRGLEFVQEAIAAVDSLNAYKHVSLGSPQQATLPTLEFTVEATNGHESVDRGKSGARPMFVNSRQPSRGESHAPLATARSVYVGNAGKKVEPPKGAFKPSNISSPYCV